MLSIVDYVHTVKYARIKNGLIEHSRFSAFDLSQFEPKEIKHY